jgi:hypothetical protein
VVSREIKDLCYLMILTIDKGIKHWWKMNETWVWSIGGMRLTGENISSQWETHPCAKLSTTNPHGLAFDRTRVSMARKAGN